MSTLVGDRGGETYDRALDFTRLNAQAQRVWDAMQDGKYHTLDGISKVTGDPPASVSARLRDFRKAQFGGHEVRRKRHPRRPGLYGYRLIPRSDR